jgi:mono/diheme cytochrome c family protein
LFPPAANLTADRSRTKSDGQLFWLIAHGVNYTGMPAFGKDFGGGNSDDDIWKLVAYIRSLQGELPTPVAAK